MEQIRIDLVPGGVTPNAHATQYDVGRGIRFLLYNGGNSYTLAGTETITVDVTKPDGSTDTVSVTNTSSNYVDFVTTDGLLNQAGLYPCELSIVNGTDVIGSQNFNLRAEADAYDGADIVTVTVGPADICTFTTNLAEPLQSVTVDIEATGGNGSPDNPISINGYSSANITRCGVNLMHVNSRVSQTTAYVAYTSDDNYIYLNGTKSGGGYADMSNLTMTLPKGTYYLKAFVISGTASGTVSLYAFNGTDNISGDILGGEKSMTLNDTTTFRFRFAIWADGTVCSNYKIGIVISTASISEYSEYTGNTYAIAFGQTVYGGQLIILPDRTYMHVTHKVITMDGSQSIQTSSNNRFYVNIPEAYKVDASNQTTYKGVTSEILAPTTWAGLANTDLTCGPVYGNGIAFRDDTKTSASDWTTYFTSNPTKFRYELATPFDIDLTPEVISAIVGTNNVWADCGQTTVKYLKAGA